MLNKVIVYHSFTKQKRAAHQRIPDSEVTPLASVGIIANPAAGKDIRRLVAQGRFVPNQEKVNTLKRILAGLDAAGVSRAVMMPDMAMLGKAAIDGATLALAAEFIDMPVFNEERDTVRASRAMADMRVGCIITLGGDGTNRAVAKACRDIPLVPVSTGTNNVFPVMTEGTLAGLAAGVIARRLAPLDATTTRSKRLEIYIDDALADIALVDVAISRERFVGARAIWDMNTVSDLYLARAEPASIGLSAIGAQLTPIGITDPAGLHITLATDVAQATTHITAPVAPGMVIPVHIAHWRALQIADRAPITLRPCTIALDGERALTLRENQQAYVQLTDAGPRVVSIDAALRDAALNGAFRRET